MSNSKGDQEFSKDVSRTHDKLFKGPIAERSCTDILCCVIFLVFILLLIFVTFWAYIFGDMNKLIHPTNSEGQLCGISKGFENKPKLVFFDLFACVKMGPALIAFGCPTKQICVSKCPTTFWAKFIQRKEDDMVCVGDKNGKDPEYINESSENLVAKKLCAAYVFPSIDVSGRCLPDLTKLLSFFEKNDYSNRSANIINQVKEYNKLFGVAEVAGKILNDLQKSYQFIIVCFVLALVLSLIYLLLLRFFARFMVWLTLIMFVLIFAAGAVVCFFTYYLLQPTQADLKNKLSWYTPSTYQNDKFWLGMGIGIAVVLLILLLMLIFLRNRIKIAIAILNSTSKSLGYMMGLLIWPVILFVMQIVLIGGCILLAMQLSTVRRPEGVADNIHNLTYVNGSEMRQQMEKMLQDIPCVPGENTTTGRVCTFVKYGTKTYVYIFMFFVLFMFFWLTNFIKALGQITIAGAFASYYFAFRKPQDIPTFPVILSFWRAVRYHLGSLAFGSLILAIVQFIKALLEYLDQKAKSSGSIVAEFLVKCLKCCFWCLEQFIKFLNKNAFIMIAIYGQNFCSAAKNAFNLILRNIVRVFVVDKVTNFVLFMGKLVIVGCIGILSFFFFNGTLIKDSSPKLFYFYVPVIIIVIGTYIISTMFFQIFDMGADTIFLCFCEDLERNDGSPEKPYFMSKELMSILGKKNNNDPMELK